MLSEEVKERLRQRLDQVHEWPSVYMYKFIFEPDAERGVKVTGADVSQFCKLCQECIAVCPEKLFFSAPFEEHWQKEEVSVS